MTAGTDALIQAFRLWVTDNVPASGANWPNKSEIIAGLTRLAVDIGAAQAGLHIESTTAARDAYYATSANQGNLVYVNNNNGSATDPANGVYEYVDGDPRLAEGFYAGVATVVEPFVNTAVAAAGFPLLSDATTFASGGGMTSGQTTEVRQTDTATHAAVAGEVHLDGTPATPGDMIPNEGVYTWNGAALLRTGSTQRQLTEAIGLDLASKDMSYLRSRFPRERTAPLNFNSPIKDKAGKVLADWRRDGLLHLFAGIMLNASSSGEGGRTAGGKPFSGRDAAGKRIWSIDENGRWYLQLDDEAVDHLRGQLGVNPSAVFRGVAAATDVTASADLVRGYLREGARGCHIVQRVAGALDTAIVAHDEPLIGCHVFGQSNAGPTGTVQLTTALYLRHALAFSAGVFRHATDGLVTPGTLNDLVPARDTVAGNTLAVATAYAHEQRCIARGESSPGMLVRADYRGGTPIENLQAGSITNDNLLASISQGFIVAAAYGRGYAPVVIWDQGENGAAGYDTHKGQLATLVDDLRATVEADHGLTLPFLYWQVNLLNGPTNGGVARAQRDFSRDRRDSNIALIGPTYPFPTYNDGASDQGTHVNALGRMMQGELTDLAMAYTRERGRFQCLDVLRVVRTGASIVIDFIPPSGCEDGDYGLTFDTDWVNPPPGSNKGFTYADDSSSATISSVAITGRWQVTVTLSAVPTGANKLIRYALVADGAAYIGNWVNCRGQLYADSHLPSAFAAGGYAIPGTIRHYGVAFEESAV